MQLAGSRRRALRQQYRFPSLCGEAGHGQWLAVDSNASVVKVEKWLGELAVARHIPLKPAESVECLALHRLQLGNRMITATRIRYLCSSPSTCVLLTQPTQQHSTNQHVRVYDTAYST
jgi:hypothetical protein